MVRDVLFNLLLLWSLGHDLHTTGLKDDGPKEQSWSNQNLYSVPLDLDVRLRKLDLSNNFIRQLHTLDVPYLEQLDLSSNQLELISEGAFDNLALLEELNLSVNALNTNLDRNSKSLQSIGRLKILDISMNSLGVEAVKLYLQNKSSLEKLKMTGNSLTTLTRYLFKENQGLRSITIDDNLISAIDAGTFELLDKLQSLHLAKNNLAHICDFKLPQVKYLNLSRNSIQFFVTAEDNQVYNLEILDLSHNKLLYFPILPKLNQLKYLYLRHNMMGTLTSEASMVLEVNSLYNDVVKKGDIRITKNYLHSNWRLMPLIYIDISYNHFTSFPLETLSLLSSLEELNFSFNCLQKLTWTVRHDSESGHYRQLYFPSLKYLNMQSNGLKLVSPLFLQALTQVETINLQDNSVKPCAPVSQLQSSTSQQQLNFNSSCLAFGKLRTLKYLNLENNGIRILHANAFKKTCLISLNLARNFHMVMQAGALEGVQETLQSLMMGEVNMNSSDMFLPCLPALTHLNISNNNLNVLPHSLSCSPLRELSIQNNSFLSLNQSLILALSTHLHAMYISGNAFNCCDAHWLRILNESRIKLPDVNQSACFTDNTRIQIGEYLTSSSLYCSPHIKGIHLGEMIIVVLFLTIMITVSIMFTRKLCSIKESFVV
ncbi:transforming growth factor beta activator LRRC33-like [Dunckerocampus dactyliophorus]|uniref:transforming growth factor beta activator LRRC33-like n=1 Tax=Dunckerocampus dactyliophorus TaxID=161453 RepID=UPI00240576C9|nr:transforming growth factor beta activator LRRC33-like [Dunckerocampus dactyliophorus]